MGEQHRGEIEIQIRNNLYIMSNVESSGYPASSTKEDLMAAFSEMLDEFFDTRDRIAAKPDTYWTNLPTCECGHHSSGHHNLVRTCYICPTGKCAGFRDVNDNDGT